MINNNPVIYKREYVLLIAITACLVPSTSLLIQYMVKTQY
jgi:hypothetical protein